jgi:hypothetical protein
LLIDQGATAEQDEAALATDSCADSCNRDAQIREVTAWLAGNDATRH